MRTQSLVVFSVLGLAACIGGKDEGKGVVDESDPPSIPTQIGKADGADQTISVSVQSVHPYTNNLNKTYSVPLSALPSCAKDIRLHFSVLRTEADYDFVTVEPTGAPVQSFDGDLDNTWTEWFKKSGTSVRLRLKTDGSVTRHGFIVDQVEWDGVPDGCGVARFPECPAGTVDVAPEPALCGCPIQPECVAVADLDIRHQTYRGFNRHAHSVHGDVASETHPGPADGPETTQLGHVDGAKVAALFDRAANLGLLQGAGYDRPITGGAMGSALTLTAGSYSVSFAAIENQHDAAVQQLVNDFEALFECGTPTGTLSCDQGLVCENNTCVEDQSCICPAIFMPVCSTNGTTYSNSCAAGCAQAEVAHSGECGIPGDPCGTIRGLTCTDANKCRFGASQFTYPFPDAGGTCVAKNYCDAPADCNGLPHPAVLGNWACNASSCAWAAGVQWNQLAGGAFETAHPYASSTSVWKEITLPANGQAMRLRTASGFALENNYDFLEVWTWTNGAWKLANRYTGSNGPALTQEWTGRYFYLRFVSDSSVTKQGFAVAAEWR
jgi:hypothetical protein